ncbi:MAG: hemolysin family protein [Candidatus Eisenbacteria bacterium]
MIQLYLIGVVGALALFGVSAFLTAAESAFFHLPKPERMGLREAKDPRATRLLALLDDPRRLTLSLRLTNVTLRTLAVTLLTVLALRFAPVLGIHTALLLAIHVAVALIVIVGPSEVIPRAYGITHARDVALRAAPIMTVFDLLSGPFLRVLVGILRRTATLFGFRWAIPYLTAEDVIAVVEAGEEKGEIEEEEREMIHSILELGDTAVREVMIPRVDMVAVERRSPVREALAKITERGHSRIPVYDGQIDNIVGVVYAKDLLRAPYFDNPELPVETAMREAFFVPEGKRVDDLLREFQREKVHLAVVVDEYGGTAGLITMEDVLEEIVGEIQDEYDREDVLFESTGPDSALVNAKIPIDDLNERFNISIPAELHDTLGGYLYDLNDRVPVEGETFADPESGLLFKVEKVDRQRIARVRIRRLPSDEISEGRKGTGGER